MPRTPKRPCRYPGCPNLCDSGVYCRKHSEYSADRMRGSAAERGYDGKWRAARDRYLRRNPLCAECLKAGIIKPATVVDHIIPHRGNEQLFWDEKTGSLFARTAMIERLAPGFNRNWHCKLSIIVLILE